MIQLLRHSNKYNGHQQVQEPPWSACESPAGVGGNHPSREQPAPCKNPMPTFFMQSTGSVRRAGKLVGRVEYRLCGVLLIMSRSAETRGRLPGLAWPGAGL